MGVGPTGDLLTQYGHAPGISTTDHRKRFADGASLEGHVRTSATLAHDSGCAEDFVGRPHGRDSPDCALGSWTYTPTRDADGVGRANGSSGWGAHSASGNAGLR